MDETNGSPNLSYPFAAIVGQDGLKTCLLLCAIDPSIGGVLIRGDKGTAKSTAARGLTKLLPHLDVTFDPISGAFDPYNRNIISTTTSSSNSSSSHSEGDNGDDRNSNNSNNTINNTRSMPTPFVDLPIGATEDRVLGSLDFSATIKQGGERVFAPGLLAAANRGILYIDEVNLLPAHLVDVLLDAAAMGVNTVHREGITMTHPANFMLIGTMNPEEGDLRPQLLDRFGLMVDVLAPKDAAVRAEVVRKRLAFENDRATFQQQWQDDEQRLAQKIQDAKERLPNIRETLPDDLLLLMSQICTEFNVDSLRADITLYKAATALAAWEGKSLVEPDDIRQAAQWVLSHRRRQRPFQGQSQTQEQQDQQDTDQLLDDLINNHASNNQPDSQPSEVDENKQQQPEQEQKEQDPQDSEVPQDRGGKSTSTPDSNDAGDDDDDQDVDIQTFTASKPTQIKQLKLGKQQKGQHGAGKRNQITNAQQKGRYVRSAPTDKPVDLALDATLRASVANGIHPETGLPVILPENWRRKVRNSTTDTIIMFLVDASGSMSARQRMEAVKGAVLALLNNAYQQRDRVGVIAFRGHKAEVLLEPTRSIELAEKQLQRLPTGGRTPLAHALSLTLDTIQRLTRYEPEQAMLLIVLSDGKANVPLPSESSNSPNGNITDGANAWTQTEQIASRLAAQQIPTLMLDTEAGHVRVGRGVELADVLQANYLRLDDLSSDGLVHTIRQAVTG